MLRSIATITRFCIEQRKAMEERSQSFDICIVCALYEEARAVLDEFSTRCSVSFTEAFSRVDQYAYRQTTIENKYGEPLTVLVTDRQGEER